MENLPEKLQDRVETQVMFHSLRFPQLIIPL